MNLLLIAIGGALGSVARYLFSTLVLRATGSLFPIGTFAVNAVGCFIFGLIAGAAEQRVALPPEMRAFVLIGILGGFTTLSSYSFDVIEIVDAPDQIEAFMPDLEQMVGDGLITLERAEVLLYRRGRQ